MQLPGAERISYLGVAVFPYRSFTLGTSVGGYQSVADSLIRQRVHGSGPWPENTWPAYTAPVTDLIPSDA